MSEISTKVEETPQVVKKKTIFHWSLALLGQTLWYSFLLLLILLLGLALSLQFSVVQTGLFKQGLAYFSANLGFEASSKSIYLDWYNSRLHLYDFQVKDPEQHPMISAEQLIIDFDYQKAFANGDVRFEEVTLDHAQIQLITSKKTEQMNINVFIRRINEMFASDKPKDPNSPYTTVSIAKARLIDSYFGLEDERQIPLDGESMDFAHLKIDHLEGEIHDFRTIADTVELRSYQLRGIERKTQLEIHQLNTFFRLTEATMEFRKLLAKMGESILRDDIFMSYRTPEDLSDFTEKVNIIAHLDSSIIYTKDLAKISPEVAVFDDIWRIKGTFRGKVSDFKAHNMDIYLGDYSHLKGDIEMMGLPNISETFMTFKLKDSQISGKELSKYIPNEEVQTVLKRLAYIDFEANLTGFVSDFVANGQFRTDLGYIQSDINLKLTQNQDFSYYKGYLKTENLNIGRLFEREEIVQKLDMEGRVEGRGFRPEIANLRLDAQIDRLGFNQYDYQDIRVDGTLNRERFDGKLVSKDENFNLSINGEVNFGLIDLGQKRQRGRFDLNSKIEYIDLRALNFSPKELLLKGQIDADTYGLSLDELSGDLSIYEAELIYDGRALDLPSLHIFSFEDDEAERFFQLDSDYLNFLAQGKFRFSEIIGGLETLLYEYWLSLRNKPEMLAEYYEAKQEETSPPFTMNFEANFKNINPVINLFEQNIFISNNAKIRGLFKQDKTTQLNLELPETIDSIAYDNLAFLNIDFELFSSKSTYNNEILAQAALSSKKQSLGNIITENTNLDVVWGNGLLDFSGGFRQEESHSAVNLGGEVLFKEQETEVKLKKADLLLLGDRWKINPNNLLTFFSDGSINIDSLSLRNQETSSSQINLQGRISKAPEDEMNINIEDVNILVFTSFFGQNISGFLDANASLKQVLDSPDLSANIKLYNLMIDELLISNNTFGDARWNHESKGLNINLNLVRFNRPILDLYGYVYPLRKENALNLKADFNRTDIEILSPFLEGLASDLGGDIDGQLNITGRLDAPEVLGELEVVHGQFRLDYLQTLYEAEGRVQFIPNEIRTKNFYLLDEHSQPATVTASVFHDGLQNFLIEAKSQFYDFQLLNTKAEDNSLFYGTAYATGDLRIYGFLNQLNMDVRAKSRKGSQLFLPLSGYEEVNQKDYIQFVKPDNQKDVANKIEKIDLGGLKLNFDLELNNDAAFEIIFDEKTGDIMRGKGHGNIEMNVDTEGDFSIFGNYIIDQGRYNFTFGQVVNKSFKIQRGSRLAFNGDIYESILDVKAAYTRYVPMKPLINLQTVTDPENSEYQRAYPVSALLRLKGPFLSPTIDLDIDLEEPRKSPNNNIQTAVMQLNTRIRNDEQERNKQVFSLLILNRLSPISAFTGVNGVAGRSLGEVISNQFSNWLSQVDKNLELNFDVDADNFNALQFRVSYSLMDGRLRVTRDGGFTNTQNQADVASIVGDWTVEYLLTPGGKYRVKMYNRTNANQLNNVSINNNTTTTAGFSIMHTASFDRFDEIFKSRKKIEEKEKANLLSREEKKDYISFNENEEASDSLENTPKTEEKVNYERITLPHRNDRLDDFAPQGDSSQSRQPTTATNKPPKDTQPSKQNYLEGDEDNVPMPDAYRKRLGIEEPNPERKEDTKPEQDPTKLLKKVNENKDLLPLPKRFSPALKSKPQKRRKS